MENKETSDSGWAMEVVGTISSDVGKILLYPLIALRFTGRVLFSTVRRAATTVEFIAGIAIWAFFVPDAEIGWEVAKIVIATLIFVAILCAFTWSAVDLYDTEARARNR